MQENQQTEVPSDRCCCTNCKWYESRTEFCRKNPPTPFPVFIKGIGVITNSGFPKISLPDLDWCSCFKNKHQSVVC